MMVSLFLDDVRPCPKDFILCRNLDQMFLEVQEHRGNIFAISLDHDLGCDNSGYYGAHYETGYDFCKWLIEQPAEVWPHFIYFHTSNPVGRENMRQLLTRYAPEGCIVSR